MSFTTAVQHLTAQHARHVQVLRSQAPANRRERSHLLYLYDALVGCVSCREPRVREQLRDVLQLAGTELGLTI